MTTALALLPESDPIRLSLVRALDDRANAARETVAMASRHRSRLDALADRRRLTRSVMVVDDKACALVALVQLLAPIGCAIYAVTDDRTPRTTSTLAGCGANVRVLVVHDYGEVPGLCRRHRCAVLVVDEHLHERDGTEHSGAELAASLPRGPRVFVVTSDHAARASLADATRVTQAHAVIRTDRGEWADGLRALVHAAVDEAAG